jgi:hypothetical protein
MVRDRRVQRNPALHLNRIPRDDAESPMCAPVGSLVSGNGTKFEVHSAAELPLRRISEQHAKHQVVR